jgi:hypothetical protein
MPFAIRALPVVLAAAGLAGCASVPLDEARSSFYEGRFYTAEHALREIPARDHNTVLYLMERGMIRQSLGDLEGSTSDWLLAVALGRGLETYSLSKGAASLLSNDLTQSFRGYPFERTLLHTFLALNFLLQSDCEGAAVESRNVAERQSVLAGYPDDAFSRHVAGTCLQAAGESDNAAIQFAAAAVSAPQAKLDPATGRFASPGTTHAAAAAATVTDELVCYLAVGRATAPHPTFAPAVDLYTEGRWLGRATPLANTAALAAASEARMAAQRAAKEVARVALKETVASVVEEQNEALGEVLRILLFSLEQPDTRRWETLPLWLLAARVPCPADLRSLDVVFGTGPRRGGPVIVRLQGPFARCDRTHFVFCRDLPLTEPQPPAPVTSEPAGPR